MYPADTLAAFRDLARAHGIALIVDETYRDFDSRTGRPHEHLTDPKWPDSFIHLYSFSRFYRPNGHRVGAVVASEDRLSQIATVYAKPSVKPKVDSYVREVPQDIWIFFLRDTARQYVQPFRGQD